MGFTLSDTMQRVIKTENSPKRFEKPEIIFHCSTKLKVGKVATATLVTENADLNYGNFLIYYANAKKLLLFHKIL